jgi:hypothetical protein
LQDLRLIFAGRGLALTGVAAVAAGRARVKVEWKMTETNRRARFYTHTSAGCRQLGLELSQFRSIARTARASGDPRPERHSGATVLDMGFTAKQPFPAPTRRALHAMLELA